MTDDAQTKKQERKSRGLARIWTDAEIAQMCQITALDIVNAERWWRRHAPPRFRKILKAKSIAKNARTEQSSDA